MIKYCNKCQAETERYSDRKCKVCKKRYAKDRYWKAPKLVQEVALNWKKNNRERARVSGRKGGRLGWLPGEHERAERERAFVTECAVCKSKDPRHKRGWNADHDHKTGVFRSHVCHPCNIAISHVEKYALDRGPQIAEYLKHHENRFHQQENS